MFQLTWQDANAWRRQASGEIPAPPPDPVVTHAGMLCWEEHCVECAMPQCYSTCSLYVPRADRKCARFVWGIMPNATVQGLFPFGADIRFRRWAKLQADLPAKLAMPSTMIFNMEHRVLSSAEQLVSGCATVLRKLSPTRKLNGAFTVFRRKFVQWQSRLFSKSAVPPQGFLVKCWSPENQPIRLQLEVVTDVPVYRKSLTIAPGWNEHILDAAEILASAKHQPGRFRISVDNDQEVRLVFTWLHFVALKAAANSDSRVPDARNLQQPFPAARIKCVAWDLDNTLWNGVIGDAGTEGVQPNEELLGLVGELDRRGILQTIVSKNNYEVAWPKIEQLGLADYFLYPAIHWGPKSRSLQQIADELNINIDTFAMIDDSPFERREVSQLLPQVRVFDPAAGASLMDDPAFDVMVTPETSTRRLQYLTEAKRKRVHQSWRGDYDEFLRSCRMVLRIRNPRESDFSRCLELLQRSNQFNLNGRKYEEPDFRQLLSAADHACFCFEVSDDFGSYGIVGVAAFRATPPVPVLVDFVMSCRVAQKKVEAAFLAWYAAGQFAAGIRALRAELKVTSRNMPLREVLEQLKFQCISMDGPVQLLEQRLTDELLTQSIIAVEYDADSQSQLPDTAGESFQRAAA